MKTITINDIRTWNPCYDPSKLIESLKDLILCADAENWISDTLIHDICTQAINEYAKGEAE